MHKLFEAAASVSGSSDMHTLAVLQRPLADWPARLPVEEAKRSRHSHHHVTQGSSSRGGRGGRRGGRGGRRGGRSHFYRSARVGSTQPVPELDAWTTDVLPLILRWSLLDLLNDESLLVHQVASLWRKS